MAAQALTAATIASNVGGLHDHRAGWHLQGGQQESAEGDEALHTKGRSDVSGASLALRPAPEQQCSTQGKGGNGSTRTSQKRACCFFCAVSPSRGRSPSWKIAWNWSLNSMHSMYFCSSKVANITAGSSKVANITAGDITVGGLPLDPTAPSGVPTCLPAHRCCRGAPQILQAGATHGPPAHEKSRQTWRQTWLRRGLW